MKKFIILTIALMFAGIASASNLSERNKDVKAIAKINNPVLVTGGCTVRVDCDGDGIWDYEYTIDYQYAGALAQQFIDAC